MPVAHLTEPSVVYLDRVIDSKFETNLPIRIEEIRDLSVITPEPGMIEIPKPQLPWREHPWVLKFTDEGWGHVSIILVCLGAIAWGYIAINNDPKAPHAQANPTPIVVLTTPTK